MISSLFERNFTQKNLMDLDFCLVQEKHLEIATPKLFLVIGLIGCGGAQRVLCVRQGFGYCKPLGLLLL